MRHGRAGFKLGRLTAHRWAMFRNLLVALFRHERIMTTEAKAKAMRGLADQMVTLAKRDTLHARRQVLTMVPDPAVVKKLFDTIAARFGDRHGGYTRIIKAGTRPGDRAPGRHPRARGSPRGAEREGEEGRQGGEASRGDSAGAGAARGRKKRVAAAAS
jgi:large subunit ribosomal protein L17